MKSAVLVADNKVECIEITKPRINKNQNVLIKVAYCGICGSDMSKYVGDKTTSKDLILGHEFCGWVEDGPDYLLNKFVTVIPLWYCNYCDNCRDGNYQLCSNQLYLGSTIDGGMQEYITVPEKYVYPIEELENHPKLGTLIEPLACAVHAVDLLYTKNLSYRKIGIVGFGNIGKLIKLVLMHHLQVSEEQIIAIDKDTQIEDNSIDYCYECSGTIEGLNSAISCTKCRGNIIQIGIIYPHKLLKGNLNFDKLLRKEQILIGSWNSDFHNDWKIAYDLIKNNIDCYSKIISHIFYIEDANEAFKTKLNTNVDKVLIKVIKENDDGI